MGEANEKYKEQHTWAEFRAILESWLAHSGGYGPCNLEKAEILGAIAESNDTKHIAMLKEVLATIELLTYYWPEPKFDR